MLKFIKHHMAEIGGIEIYPVISFLIFFLFFIVVTIMVFTIRKDHYRKMSELPLAVTEQNEEFQS